MESIRRRYQRSRFHHNLAVGSAGASENIAEALKSAEAPATQEQITQLLGSIESALAASDADDVRMSEGVKGYASHVEKHLDKVAVGVQISKHILGALGNLPWVGVGLTVVAMGLDMCLKMHDAKDQCKHLMRQYLDVWKRYMRPVLEMEGPATDTMVESMDIIVEGYRFLKKMSNAGSMRRLLLASNYSQEIEKLSKKLDSFMLKEIFVNTLQLRRPGCTPASFTLPTIAVALEGRKEHVMGLLKLETREETRVVVLHGMGGVGKSLLASAVYNEACTMSRERRYCRIELGEKPSRDHIVNMQMQMIRSLTDQNLDKDSEAVANKLRQVLQSEAREPFLIYIDNVLRQKDLDDFLALDCEMMRLPKGSRWLVTTRDEAVCTRIFKRNPHFTVEDFKVKTLTDKDAQRLFCLHAFGLEEPSSEVMKEYDDGRGMMEGMVTRVCGNLPLALRVLGRSLYGERVQVWRRKYDSLKKNLWELERLEERVTNVVKSSYDTLDEETQTAFLMACVCFQGYLSDVFKRVVECILPRATTSRLFELGLLELSIVVKGGFDVVVRMHDVVRDLGHRMAAVRKYAPTITPTCEQDLLLGGDEMWSGVKWLRVPALEGGIEARLIERCSKLEVIVLGAAVNGQIANPPLPLKVIIHDEDSTSSVVPWRFEKLKELVYCYLTTPIQDFSVVAPSAERLQVFGNFGGCEIPREAIDLHCNTLLELRCVKTARLSSFFCRKMTKLQDLWLLSFQGEHLPKDMGHLENLQVLFIRSSTVQEIPQSLGNLHRLQKLRLILKELREVPSGVFKGLSELAVLQLDLERLTSFPIHELGQLTSLEVSNLHLPAIDRLAVQQDGQVCVELRQLKDFKLLCDSVSTVEGVRLACPSLERLVLGLGEVKTLPPRFIDCSTKLQALSLVSFFSLEKLCKETEILSHARTWVLWNCPALKEIPDGMMKAVEALMVVGCRGMQRLPADVDEHKARSMRFLACDALILPLDFTVFPSVLSVSLDDPRAEEEAFSFYYETFLPPSHLGLL